MSKHGEIRTCRLIAIDGVPIRVQGGTKAITEQDIVALGEAIRVVKAKMQAERDAIGPHEHQWKCPLKDGRMAFCTVCKDRKGDHESTEVGPERAVP